MKNWRRRSERESRAKSRSCGPRCGALPSGGPGGGQGWAGVSRWREADGPFLAIYNLRLKAAFTAATGRRTQRDRLDPLDRALSLDAPLSDDPDADTLEAVVEDPAGAAAIEEAEAHSDHQQLHGLLGHALGALPAEQREVVRRRYYRGQTVAEIATATGVPEKEVRKLEAAALRVLRHPRVSQVLREYR